MSSDPIEESSTTSTADSGNPPSEPNATPQTSDAGNPVPNTPTPPASGDNGEIANNEVLDPRFGGFGFGIAIGAMIDPAGRDRIDSASLDENGIVRIDKDNNTRAAFILETHYFFLIDRAYLGVKRGGSGFGPFVSVQPGSSNIIESIGFGVMIGFSRANVVRAGPEAKSKFNLGDSFNIGIGYTIDPNAKVLGDGIRKNRPLPTGETQVRLKETTQEGFAVLLSYSFL